MDCLRIVDPEFKTPVAIDIALMNIFSIPGIGLCLVLVYVVLFSIFVLMDLYNNDERRHAMFEDGTVFCGLLGRM